MIATETSAGPRALSRADLIAHLERVGETYSFETALDKAEERGFGFRLTWLNPTIGYTKVWEHGGATAYNDTIDPRSAGGRPFMFTLYEIRDECTGGGGVPWVLMVGYLGNTANYEVRVRE